MIRIHAQLNMTDVNMTSFFHPIWGNVRRQTHSSDEGVEESELIFDTDNSSRNFPDFAIFPNNHRQTALTKLSALLFRRALVCLRATRTHSGICFSGIVLSPLREVFIVQLRTS